jgi:diadenosine tetraphosphate (Ap4A) HIT family hydrolase
MNNFLNIFKNEDILYNDDIFYIVKDQYPVSPGHLLIISRQVRKDFFDLTELEKHDLNSVIIKAKELIEKDYMPDGYNIGMNCGSASGQTVFHFHCHVIPRYTGDSKNPRGGVRNCMNNGTGNY